MQMNLNRNTSAILASSKRIPEGVCRRREIILQTEIKPNTISQMLFNLDDEFVYRGKSLFPDTMRISSSKS